MSSATVKDAFIFSDTEISRLSASYIAKYFAEPFVLEKSAYAQIRPEILEINSGIFSKHGLAVPYPLVSIIQAGDAVVLTCSCSAVKSKLCFHQAEVLYSLFTSSDQRLFFDPLLRRQRLRAFAKDYGLENEPDLDVYFKLHYNYPILSIDPIKKEILRFEEENPAEKKWDEGTDLPAVVTHRQLEKKAILVLCQHKYYQQFSVILLQDCFTKTGKIKQPINAVDPAQLIWETKDFEVLKFYAALSRFQRNAPSDKTMADFEALSMLVKNPLELNIFYHDKTISEKLTATSIKAAQLDTLTPEITISVFKKEPFYEITGTICINDIIYPFKDIQISFQYFLQLGSKFWLIPNAHILSVLTYFKNNHQIILVHHSKYEVFRKEILAGLEQSIRIKYAYIQQATKKQLKEQLYEQKPKKILYLADAGDFVSITPVISYGNQEISVFSKKQIFDTDLNENIFQVERDEAMEIAFTALIMQQHVEFETQILESRYFYLHKDKFLDEDWFLEAFEKWRHADIEILGFNGLKRNKKNTHKAKITIRVTSGIDWFKTALSVEFGKQRASLRQLYTAVKNKNKFVHLDDGTIGMLPDQWIRKFSEYFKIGEIEAELLKIPKSNFSDVRELFDQEVLSKEVKTEIATYSRALCDKARIEPVQIPGSLKVVLRKYQQDGVNWLNLLDTYNFGGCLADDMGLGKTLQVIAFILTQRAKMHRKTNLIIVPTSLLFNWETEIQKFAPSIKRWTHYGASRLKTTGQFDDYEIVLTTYGTLLSDIQFLRRHLFNYVILDESQAIKNPDSERYRAARLLQCRNRLVLTGTPFENNTFDLFGQFSFACPGLLGDKQSFKDIYAIPIDKFEDRQRARELQEKLNPFILRRTKHQVAKELPEKTEMVIYCEMGTEQRHIYNACERTLREYIAAKEEEEITKNSMHVLKGLTKLRQICNAPSLLKEEAYPSGNSAKMDVLMAQINKQAAHHKILIFSQFVSMLDLIKEQLTKMEIPFAYLSGQTKNRAETVGHFQNNASVRVFLISLKAGGTGLNLTEADYVYLVDPWWNPAVENQAIDRCYRIGQTKNVIAVRLVCPNTIEEKIQRLQTSKTQLANNLVKTDNSLFKSFSKKELLDLLI